MILNFVQIAGASRGAVSVEADGKWIRFHRFTEKEEMIYHEVHADKAYKLLSTAGVRLAFCTDSQKLSFAYRFFKQCASTQIPRIDIYANGAMISHVGLDDYEGRIGLAEVDLVAGKKVVEIYLPWSMGCELSDITLEDGASFEPSRRSFTMIAYGDSITHGQITKYPSLTYAATLARLLDADEINKGIGGEVFFPELPDGADTTAPDYITVAYGTNDWSCCSRDVVEKNCRAFYAKLSALYPETMIFAISPIWRGDISEADTPFGAPVTAVYDVICEQTADLSNVTVICGDDLIPHMKSFTVDALHPNDAGAQIYAQNLYRAIESYL